jgi:hypothetical protein
LCSVASCTDGPAWISWPELLDPEQNRPSAYIDAAISQDAGNALGRDTHLLIAADGQQNDVTPEALASHQARRLAGRVATAGIEAGHRRSLPEPLTDATSLNRWLRRALRPRQ